MRALVLTFVAGYIARELLALAWWSLSNRIPEQVSSQWQADHRYDRSGDQM